MDGDTTLHLFQTFGISLALGLFVGLERERAAKPLGGVRTFALITLFGTLTGALAPEFGVWLPAAGLLSVVGAILIGNIIGVRTGAIDEPGVTTEIAMLMMFALGAYLPVGRWDVAAALGVVVAMILHAKPTLHGVIRRMGDKDVRAMMQFALIALIVLPVLPDRAYGPFEVLNPHNIWLMVILVSGISLAGYVAYRMLGAGAGVIVGGLLGGAISSTATTVSYARRARGRSAHASMAALAIILASTVTYVRVLIEITVVAPNFLTDAAPPLLALLILSAALAGGVWLIARRAEPALPQQENPAQLRFAIIFGALYAIILFAVAAARERLGESGLYAVAGLSGLTDMDAITLSTCRLVNQGRLDPTVGWRAIVIAVSSNLVFKAGLAGALGGRALFLRVAVVFGVSILAAMAMLLFL